MAPEMRDEMEVDSADMVNDPDENQKIINEEYKTWKKNSPFLYDMIMSTALEWPTLTTQWFPDVKNHPDKNFTTHRLLLGTHTSADAPNYLQIASIELPKNVALNERDYDSERGEIGGYGSSAAKDAPQVKFKIEQRMRHPGEVNKARYQPQNSNLIATMCPDGRVLVFDRSKHPIEPDGKAGPNPQMELRGHTDEGFGLCWSPHDEGSLVSGSNDKTVRLWDLQNITPSSTGATTVKASRVFNHHTAVVNDVQYHPLHRSLIGSVSDDLTLQILDLRVKTEGPGHSVVSAKAHDDAVNAIAFNKASDFVLATGSADKTIGIWDLRNLNEQLHILVGHEGDVTTVAWHPTEEAILASGGHDRRVIFWDLSKVGEEQLPEDVGDGAPELMFMHGGHTNHLADFTWNENSPWVMCSAAEDNLIQVWKVADAIIGKDSEDIPVDELER